MKTNNETNVIEEEKKKYGLPQEEHIISNHIHFINCNNMHVQNHKHKTQQQQQQQTMNQRFINFDFLIHCSTLQPLRRRAMHNDNLNFHFYAFSNEITKN